MAQISNLCKIHGIGITIFCKRHCVLTSQRLLLYILSKALIILQRNHQSIITISVAKYCQL